MPRPSTGADAGSRIRAWISVCLVAAMLAACGGRPRDLSTDEASLAAWWCEDAARGIARVPGELRTVDASQALGRIATWVSSGPDGGLPPQLAARVRRWPALRSLLRSGLLVVVEDGMLAVAPDAKGDPALLAQRLADAENHERRSVEVLVLTLAQVDPRLEADLRKRFVEARIGGDVEAGGRRLPTAAP